MEFTTEGLEKSYARIISSVSITAIGRKVVNTLIVALDPIPADV